MSPLNMKAGQVSHWDIWSCFLCRGMVRAAKEHPNKEVPSKGMSCMEKTGRGDIVTGGRLRAPEWTWSQ